MCLFEPVCCTFLAKNGKIWYDLVTKEPLKKGSFSNKPLSLGGKAVSKSFRSSKPSPILVRNLVSNRHGING